MKKKFWQYIIVTVLFISSILSFSPIAHGQTLTVQQSIDAVKMEMKQAALAYVEPALKGDLIQSSSLDTLLSSVKKNYQATKKIILASSLSEKEKQGKLKEIDALYQEKIVKGLIPYIDAYNYATKYLDPLLNELKEAEAKNDFLAVEKVYHKLSVQLKSRTSILYRFTGKAPRDLLLEKYKKPSDIKRDEMMVPVTIIMKLTNAQQLFQTGKKEEAIKVIEDVPSLVTKLSNTNKFHQALIEELKRLQAIYFPTPVTPVAPTSPAPVTPPSTGGGGDSSGPSKSNISTIKEISVNGVSGTIDTARPLTYQVTLPTGTILANITSADIKATPTHAKATIRIETPTNSGATWQVISTAENGKSTTTYTINLTVNNAPTIANTVSIQNGMVGKELTVDLSSVFTDADNDPLTITADKGTVTGTTWVYTPLPEEAGTKITVTLTANDGRGGQVQDTFTVVIVVGQNNAPIVVSGHITSTTTLGYTAIWPLENMATFYDPDGDALTISVASSDTSIVEVSIYNNLVHIKAISVGSARLTITANDGRGGTVSHTGDAYVYSAS